MIDLLGYLGAVALALCALPQAALCYRSKSASGLSSTFLGLWYFGELFTLMYVWYRAPQVPLIINYVFNLTLLSVIVYYKLIGRGS